MPLRNLSALISHTHVECKYPLKNRQEKKKPYPFTKQKNIEDLPLKGNRKKREDLDSGNKRGTIITAPRGIAR